MECGALKVKKKKKTNLPQRLPCASVFLPLLCNGSLDTACEKELFYSTTQCK